MKRTEIAVEDATLDQLRSFAQVNLGLDLAGKENRQQMLGRIKQAGYHADKIVLFDMTSAEATADRTRERDARTFEKNGRLYSRILIQREDKPGGEEPVPVQVNGKLMWIPRGEPHDVPVEYVEALENAEAFIYEPFTGEGLGGLKPPRRVKSYPFSYA